jgi:hypothetical protein
MGAQMWADDLIIAAAHDKWNDARDHMHHLMEVTKARADKNGVTFCDDKSKAKVLVISGSSSPRTHAAHAPTDQV